MSADCAALQVQRKKGRLFWATCVLRLFSVRGYVLDRERMENGTFLGEDYITQDRLYKSDFDKLLEDAGE